VPSRDPRLETEVNSQKRETMATLIMPKQWKYLYAALMLLLLTISTLAGVGPVAAGDNRYTLLPELIPPDGIPGNGHCHGSTGDEYRLPELIFLSKCPDEGTSILPDMPELTLPSNQPPEPMPEEPLPVSGGCQSTS